MINEVKVRPYFLFSLLIGLGLILLILVRPFMTALVLAGAFAVIFRPFYLKTLKVLKYPALASMVVLLFIFTIVILPVTLVLSELFLETRQFLITEPNEGPFYEYYQIATNYINELFPALNEDFSSLRQEIVTWLIGNLNTIFSSLFKTLIGALIFFFALFYLLKDGHKFKRQLITLSPLPNNQDEQIFIKIKRTINSVVMGNLLIAVIQGTIGAIGFGIFGFSQPVLLGAITAILSLIPGVGPILVYIPTVAIKALAGDITGAIGLAIWGLIMVMPVDNLMRPFFIERGMKVHPFFILVSVLGGIIFFGPIGFILGPIILSLFFALVTIYLDNLRTEKIHE